MNTHCTLCHLPYWQENHTPIPGDDRFCQQCAVAACEAVVDILAQEFVVAGLISKPHIMRSITFPTSGWVLTLVPPPSPP